VLSKGRECVGGVSRGLWRVGLLVLLVCLVIAAFAASGVGVSSGAPGGRRMANAVGSSGREHLRLVRAESERRSGALARAEAFRRRLDTPKSRAQREISQLAFHGVSESAARRLLLRDYGAVLVGSSANAAASVARSGQVVGYLSDYEAVVRTDQGMQVESSTEPLRVSNAAGTGPVDLRLRPTAGGFAPVRPLAAVSIAQTSSGGVAVGQQGLRLTLLGADRPGSVIGGEDVFFGDVGPDMDAVAVPRSSGAELSVVLRSRLSPQEYRYRVTLPTGASLLARNDGAVVVRDGQTLARIPAPTARDAQGVSVPVEMRIAGDDLVLRIEHRAREYAYPLLVDPVVEIDILEDPPAWSLYWHGGANGEACHGDAGWNGVEYRCLGEVEHVFYASEPGNGEPIEITMPDVSVPVEVAGGGVNQGGEAEWWWMPGGEAIKAVEFVGIKGSAEPYSVAVEDGWDLMACGQNKEYRGGEAGPTSLRFAPTVGHTCLNHKYFEAEPVDISLWGTGPTEKENFEHPGIVGGSVSVAGVLITSTLPSYEEEGLGPEKYGSKNAGKPGEEPCNVGNFPVNCATGNQFEEQTDLTVGGRGLGLHLTRTYNSKLAAEQERHGLEHGPFGYGWTGSYSAHITTESICREPKKEEPECNQIIATVAQDNGSTVRFQRFGTSEPWKPIGSLVLATLVSEGSHYVYTLSNQTKLTFNSAGALLSESDRNGNTLTTSYNEKGELESVTDPFGRKLTFAYNSSAEVESAKDPLGHTVKYTYESGKLATVTQPGETKLRWKFKYNTEDEMTSETDGREHTVTTEYDLRQVVAQTDALGRKRKWEYLEEGETGFKTTITEPNGAVTVDDFGSIKGVAPGRITSVTHAYGTAIAATTTYEYNSAEERTAVIDPNKHKTEFGYDAAGNRTSEKDADGDETRWTYDKTHDIETITTPDGETTTIKRNEHGNPETVSRPAPGETTQTTKYKYDAYGDVESVTEPLERTWKYEYDTYGDRKAETDPEGNKRSWEYNEDSQETAEVSPRGNATGAKASEFTTKTERDAQGRPLKITDPLEHTTKYTYDGDGNVETVTDGNSHKAKYTYDADNELTKTEEPNKTVTETEYDSMGQVKSQTDGNKHVTKYVRNALEEIEEEVNPLGKKTLKEYDGAGNLVKLTDPKKRTATYTYDPANRLAEISYSSGTPAAIKYEYNKDDDRTKTIDGTGTSTYTYDQLDRMTESENGHKEVSKYEYNLRNQQIKITYPNAKAVECAYDKDGRLEKITDWSSNVTKYTYNADSELEKIVFPTASKDEDTYAYNDADQMTEAKMDKSTEVLASLVYTRDNDGQVKKTTAKNLPGTEVTEGTYDENNRLTKYGSVEYKYDAANNPTTQGSSTNTYNEGDELEKGTGVKYTYDELGERTKTTPEKGPATTYGYDQAGDLISVERPKEGATAEIKDTYAYNGEDLRTSQTIAGTTGYLAWDTTEELPLVLSDGTNSYIYGPGDLPSEQITSGGTITYLHHDQSGSTRLLTGSTGTVTGKCTYSAYGTPTCEGASTTPLGYDAQYTSSDTGLIYLRNRVYDPATGQSLSVDPLTPLTGEPYAYGEDNPLNKIDPSGFEAIPIPAEGPDAVACLSPETVGPCVVIGGGGYIITEGVKSIVNSWAGEEPGNDEGEGELNKKEAEREKCGNPATPPGSKFEWKGKPPEGNEEGSWFDPETREYLRPHLGESSHGPHYDYRGEDGTRWRIYPEGRIEPKP
jgi:RHS repeat-associated protein